MMTTLYLLASTFALRSGVAIDFLQVAAYISPVTEKNVTGLGLPRYGGIKPSRFCSAAFLSSGVALYGRAGRESRKARRSSYPVVQSRSVPPTPLGLVVCGSFNESEYDTMTTNTEGATAPERLTGRIPFMSCNSDRQPLFEVRAGLSVRDAIDMASAMLAAADDAAYHACEACNSFENRHTMWAAAYLIETARAVVNACAESLMEEERENG